MKTPKSQPYHRSRHRAALRAWVVAATAVASIGMPSAAVAVEREDHATASDHAADLTPAQAAQRVAADWLSALRYGDVDAALNLMAMPKTPGNERSVIDQTTALADYLSHSDAAPTPDRHRHAGHWALSSWRIDPPGAAMGKAGLIEPITLYHPAADGLSVLDEDWRVIPQGVADDPALAPLYNADHAALMSWHETVA